MVSFVPKAFVRFDLVTETPDDEHQKESNSLYFSLFAGTRAGFGWETKSVDWLPTGRAHVEPKKRVAKDPAALE
jgi:hypothetical protein